MDTLLEQLKKVANGETSSFENPVMWVAVIMMGNGEGDKVAVNIMDKITKTPELYNRPYLGWLRAYHAANRDLLLSDWDNQIKAYRDMLKDDVADNTNNGWTLANERPTASGPYEVEIDGYTTRYWYNYKVGSWYDGDNARAKPMFRPVAWRKIVPEPEPKQDEPPTRPVVEVGKYTVKHNEEVIGEVMIVFTRNGRATICNVYLAQNAKRVHAGMSVCHPNDTYDSELGRRIALKRALFFKPLSEKRRVYTQAITHAYRLSVWEKSH